MPVTFSARGPIAIPSGEDLITGLVSWWPMQENTPSSREDVHGPNDLAESNTAVARRGGIIDTYAADFEAAGLNNALRLVTHGTLSLHTAWSLMMWINVDDFSTTGALAGANLASFRIMIGATTGQPSWDINNAGQDLSGLSPLSAATEYMLVWFYDPAASFGVSINAAAPITEAVTSPIPSNTEDFWIGQEGSGGFCFDGAMGPCAWWSRVLTDDEITYLYNEGSGRLYGAL